MLFANLNLSSSCEETCIVFHVDICGPMSMMISFGRFLLLGRGIVDANIICSQ